MASSDFSAGGGMDRMGDGITSLHFQPVEDTSQKIKFLEGGKIQLPNGKVYEVKLSTGSETTTLTEEEITKHVIGILEKSQQASNFTYQDLSQTKITAHGIQTDQARVGLNLPDGAETSDATGTAGELSHLHGTMGDREISVISYSQDSDVNTDFATDYQKIYEVASRSFQEMTDFASPLTTERTPTEASKIPFWGDVDDIEEVLATPDFEIPETDKAAPHVKEGGTGEITFHVTPLSSGVREEESTASHQKSFSFGFERVENANGGERGGPKTVKSRLQSLGKKIETFTEGVWGQLKTTAKDDIGKSGREVQETVTNIWKERPKVPSYPSAPTSAHLLADRGLLQETAEQQSHKTSHKKGVEKGKGLNWENVSLKDMTNKLNELEPGQKLKIREGEFKVGSATAHDLRPQQSKKSSPESIGLMKGMVGELEKRCDGLGKWAEEQLPEGKETLLSDKKTVKEMLKAAEALEQVLTQLQDPKSDWARRVLSDSGERKVVESLSKEIGALKASLAQKQEALDGNENLQWMSEGRVLYHLVHPEEGRFRGEYLQFYRRQMPTEKLFTHLEDVQTALGELRIAADLGAKKRALSELLGNDLNDPEGNPLSDEAIEAFFAKEYQPGELKTAVKELFGSQFFPEVTVKERDLKNLADAPNSISEKREVLCTLLGVDQLINAKGEIVTTRELEAFFSHESLESLLGLSEGELGIKGEKGEMQSALESLLGFSNLEGDLQDLIKTLSFAQKKAALEEKLGTPLEISRDTAALEVSKMQSSILTLVGQWAEDPFLNDGEYQDGNVRTPVENILNKEFDNMVENLLGRSLQLADNPNLSEKEEQSIHAFTSNVVEFQNNHIVSPVTVEQLTYRASSLAKLKASVETLPEESKNALAPLLIPLEKMVHTANFISGVEGTEPPGRVSQELRTPENPETSYFTSMEALAKGELGKQGRAELLESLAEDLFQMNAQLFSDIHSSEFVNSAWEKKPDNAAHLLNALAVSDKISAFATFNLIGMTAIPDGAIETETTRDTRVEMWKFLIDLEAACVEKGNFNAALSIEAALNSSAVGRLKQTQEALPSSYQKKAAELTTLLNPEGSYKLLNEQITKRKEAREPYIPLLTSFTNQLLNLEANYTNDPTKVTRDNNGTKETRVETFFALGNPISDFQTWQQSIQPKKLQNSLGDDIMNVYENGAKALRSRFGDESKSELANQMEALQGQSNARDSLVDKLLLKEAESIEPKATEQIKQFVNVEKLSEENKEKMQGLLDLLFKERLQVNTNNFNEMAGKHGISLGDSTEDAYALVLAVKDGMARSALNELKSLAKELKKDKQMSKEERNSMLDAIKGCRAFYKLD